MEKMSHLQIIQSFVPELDRLSPGESLPSGWEEKLKGIEPISPNMVVAYYLGTGKFDYLDLKRVLRGILIYDTACSVWTVIFISLLVSLIFNWTVVCQILLLLTLMIYLAQIHACHLWKFDISYYLLMLVVAGCAFIPIAIFRGVSWWMTLPALFTEFYFFATKLSQIRVENVDRLIRKAATRK